MLMAVPGWPLPTFWTASIASTRTVSTARRSRAGKPAGGGGGGRLARAAGRRVARGFGRGLRRGGLRRGAVVGGHVALGAPSGSVPSRSRQGEDPPTPGGRRCAPRSPPHWDGPERGARRRRRRPPYPL